MNKKGLRNLSVQILTLLFRIIFMIQYGWPTCGGSLHIDDAVRVPVELPGVEGPDPHRHLHARHGGAAPVNCPPTPSLLSTCKKYKRIV